MTVEEAKGGCKDRSKWKEVISAYPKWKRAWCYVCMYGDDDDEINHSSKQHVIYKIVKIAFHLSFI
jgi:hypothetical protein